MNEESQKRMELIKAAVNGCPYYKHINMALVAYDEGKAVLEMEVVQHHANIYGAAHGGVAASIADSAAGLALSTLMKHGEVSVTLDLRINYFAPVNQGKLIAEGEVVHRGKTTAVESVKLNQNGKNVGVALVTHFIKQNRAAE